MNTSEDSYKKLFDNLRSIKKYDHISDTDLSIIAKKAVRRAANIMNRVSSELKTKPENNNLSDIEKIQVEEQIKQLDIKSIDLEIKDENYSEDGINEYGLEESALEAQARRNEEIDENNEINYREWIEEGKDPHEFEPDYGD